MYDFPMVFTGRDALEYRPPAVLVAVLSAVVACAAAFSNRRMLEQVSPPSQSIQLPPQVSTTLVPVEIDGYGQITPVGSPSFDISDLSRTSAMPRPPSPTGTQPAASQVPTIGAAPPAATQTAQPTKGAAPSPAPSMPSPSPAHPTQQVKQEAAMSLVGTKQSLVQEAKVLVPDKVKQVADAFKEGVASAREVGGAMQPVQRTGASPQVQYITVPQDRGQAPMSAGGTLIPLQGGGPVTLLRADGAGVDQPANYGAHPYTITVPSTPAATPSHPKGLLGGGLLADKLMGLKGETEASPPLLLVVPAPQPAPSQPTQVAAAATPVAGVPTATPMAVAAQPTTPTTVGSGGISVVTSTPVSLSNPITMVTPTVSKSTTLGGGLFG